MPLSSPALHRILRAAFWLAALSGLAIGAASARPAQQAASVAIEPGSLTLEVGETAQLTATVLDAAGEPGRGRAGGLFLRQPAGVDGDTGRTRLREPAGGPRGHGAAARRGVRRRLGLLQQPRPWSAGFDPGEREHARAGRHLLRERAAPGVGGHRSAVSPSRDATRRGRSAADSRRATPRATTPSRSWTRSGWPPSSRPGPCRWPRCTAR